MSTPLALQDILVSIADSLSQAQQQLNSMPLYDSFGRPNTTYQLPYLDFDIVLSAKFDLTENVESAQDTTIISGNNTLNLTGLKTRRLMFNLAPISTTNLTKTIDKPIMKKSQNDEGESKNEEPDGGEASNESKTTISGRFIAAFPNEGLPQTILNVVCEKLSENTTFTEYKIKVSLINAAGEKLVHQCVEFNFDEETTYLLNREAIIELSKNNKVKFEITAPKFNSQEEFTDENGYAETTVRINKKQNLMIVIRINSGIITKSISIY